MADAPAFDTTGPSLKLVLGGLSILILAMGVLAYYRYVQSENHFVQAQATLQEAGESTDVEGCVDAVLQWHKTCDANGPLCNHGVPKMMMHCLAAQDRSSTCDSMDLSSAKAQWVFISCRDRKTPCPNRKRCACADAYRALDSFCRHGQTGVAM